MTCTHSASNIEHPRCVWKVTSAALVFFYLCKMTSSNFVCRCWTALLVFFYSYKMASFNFVCQYWTPMLVIVCSWKMTSANFVCRYWTPSLVFIFSCKIASSNFTCLYWAALLVFSCPWNDDKFQFCLSILNTLVSLCELVKWWQPCNFFCQYCTVWATIMYNSFQKRNQYLYHVKLNI